MTTEVYLDNSATTRCCDAAIETMTKVLGTDYGNPSSLHNKGMEAEVYLKNARKTIAQSLKAEEKEIIFTSGGTESDNLALIGAALANSRRGKHVITTSIEHPAVEMPMQYLEELGYEISRLSVGSDGRIDLQELEELLREDTILVSIMHVNNEIGTIEPIAEAGELIKKKSPEILFHVDAIQSYGKIPIVPKKQNIDLLAVSGHKIHGPKGSGFLYCRKGVKIKPRNLGGGQESGYRSGTENVPAIAGLSEAVSLILKKQQEHLDNWYRQRKLFSKRLLAIPGVSINGAFDENQAPYIVSVSVENVRAEVLLHALEEKGIYVSAGSACSSNRPQTSRTLQAIGLDRELLDKTIRFSFSVFTTDEELLYAADCMEELVPQLSRYRRY